MTSNPKWSQSPNTITYENQGEMHSEYLTLNSDGSFIFIGHYEPWNGFSKGKWTDLGNSKLSLTWDEKETIKVTENNDSCAKYKIRNRSLPLIFVDLVLLKKPKFLTTVGFEGDRMSLIERIEKEVSKIDTVQYFLFSDTSSFTDERGYNIGKRILTYYYNENEILTKYTSERAYLNKEDKTKVTNEIVYFIGPNLIKYTIWPNSKTPQTNTHYFSGQKIVFSTNPEWDDIAYSIINSDILKFQLKRMRVKKQ